MTNVATILDQIKVLDPVANRLFRSEVKGGVTYIYRVSFHDKAGRAGRMRSRSTVFKGTEGEGVIYATGLLAGFSYGTMK